MEAGTDPHLAYLNEQIVAGEAKVRDHTAAIGELVTEIALRKRDRAHYLTTQGRMPPACPPAGEPPIPDRPRRSFGQLPPANLTTGGELAVIRERRETAEAVDG